MFHHKINTIIPLFSFFVNKLFVTAEELKEKRRDREVEQMLPTFGDNNRQKKHQTLNKDKMPTFSSFLFFPLFSIFLSFVSVYCLFIRIQLFAFHIVPFIVFPTSFQSLSNKTLQGPAASPSTNHDWSCRENCFFVSVSFFSVALTLQNKSYFFSPFASFFLTYCCYSLIVFAFSVPRLDWLD